MYPEYSRLFLWKDHSLYPSYVKPNSDLLGIPPTALPDITHHAVSITFHSIFPLVRLLVTSGYVVHRYPSVSYDRRREFLWCERKNSTKLHSRAYMMIQIVLSTSRLIPTETWCNPITKYIYFERELQSTKRWVWAKTSLTMKAVRVGPPGIQNKQTNGQFVLNLVLWGSSTRQCLLFFCFRPPIRRSLVQEVFKWRGAKREELWTRLREKKFSFVVPFAEWKNYLNTYYEKIYILDEGSMMSKRTVKSGAGGGREYWVSGMAAPTKMIGECYWMKTTCIYSDCSLGFEKMTKLVFTLFCHLSLQLFLRFDEQNCFELIFSHLQWAIAFQNCKFTLHF